MFTKIIETSFYDTDALGHINNTRMPVFFELARLDVFRLLCDDIADPAQWNLIMAHLDVDFIKEIFFPYSIEIRTFIRAIGTTSLTIYQEAWQGGHLCAQGDSVMVHFDFTAKTPSPLDDAQRAALTLHLMPPSYKGV